MLQIYYGEGKGKTTAAIGLAVRAAGNHMHVHFIQFMKGGPSSELNILCNIPEITVLRCDKHYGFTFQMKDKEKAELTACHNAMLTEVMEHALNGKTDLLILDEFFSAYSCNLLDRGLADQLIFSLQNKIEIVLTGHDPEQKFLAQADYISEIQCIKHPYNKGISARAGIEY